MENNKEFRTWLDDMKLDHPLVIAGPCSAETEEQVLKIAHELKNTDATVFRAGVWKPRTRPGGFEGVGAVALPWLKKVKEQTGLLTAVEVANVAHVKLALEADVDILWLGARTTVNPFAVQEVADALEGTDKIVLIKNPINPDLALWLGGVERLYKANIKNLGVIHRGFSSYKKTRYRNVPQWQLPIELKRQYPDLPIINDPSHICGNRTGIQEISQIALDLNFEGLMIETHIDPDNAWSDAAQQITPARLVEIMNDLRVRKPKAEGEALDQLQQLRAEIDVIDNHIIDTLVERMKVAEQIGEVKKSKNISILQDARWGEILKTMVETGEKAGLSPEFIEGVFKAIHQESINKQEAIVTSK
ncbi:bifunctional 3-deoxy-7-phosphoheptulonate synthase/chorismate mutase type II [Wenyingzhuangia aestuarii]|uniref:bifunctional 3-deoxy-7-phosphoheptulonate synthase/chorismate mutase type II n=1 Tax=Wenyingzhuangia aestuarii TaxID=1647582 RepID=UPI00143BCFAB|nr:bifunctional 3-deoxy-7-phosphoheptulonate synthase/chorismate mutase type II [Wenyingzhuangia aestuarii]NJB83240.1 chorismate mutase [Wenyingzhuangia aestuarii]